MLQIVVHFPSSFSLSPTFFLSKTDPVFAMTPFYQSAQNISIEHEVHQTDEGNARFVRVERLNTIHNDDFPERIPDLAKPSRFLFNLVHACKPIGRLDVRPAGPCVYVQSPTESNLCWSVFGTWGGGGRGLPARSTDGGRTWTLVKNPRGWTEGHAKNMQVLSSAAPYALAVAHAKKGLVTSCDGGESWAEMSTNALPCARRVVSLAAADGALYAGTAGRGGNPPQVWRSADKGRAWECIFAPASSEADGPIEGMAVSGRRIAVVVKCIGKRGGCWLSEDGGSTWRRVYHEKPWNDLNAVAFCGGRLFVASRNARWHDDGFGGHGLLSCDLDDVSNGWTRHSQGGFDRPEIMSLAADPFDKHRLLVGTWGNSMSVLSTCAVDSVRKRTRSSSD